MIQKTNEIKFKKLKLKNKFDLFLCFISSTNFIFSSFPPSSFPFSPSLFPTPFFLHFEKQKRTIRKTEGYKIHYFFSVVFIEPPSPPLVSTVSFLSFEFEFHVYVACVEPSTECSVVVVTPGHLPEHFALASLQRIAEIFSNNDWLHSL